MSDDEIRAVLDASLDRGISVAETRERLAELRIPEGRTFVYARTAERPQAMLARIFDAGGPWPRPESSTLRWVDVTLIYEPDDHLADWLLSRDGVRYGGGGPAFGPSREPMAPVRSFPSPVPPPVDPFKDAH